MVTSVLSAVAQIAADVVTAGAGGEALGAAEKAATEAATASAKAATAEAAAKAAVEAAEKAAASAAVKTAADEALEAATKTAAKAATEAAAKAAAEATARTAAINDMAKKLSDGHLIDGLKNFSTKQVTVESLTESLKVRMAPNKGDVLAKTPEAVAKLATSINAINNLANHPDMSADQKNFAIAQTVLSDASIVDPTGIVGIVSAYTQPMCKVIGPPAGQ